MAEIDPLFLTLDEVRRIHQFQVQEHGGDAAVRDLDLLRSAVAQPPQRFGGTYLHRDLPETAAAYMYHIVLNRPFVDGNKRTGVHAAIVFLALNEIEVDLPDDQADALTLRVALGGRLEGRGRGVSPDAHRPQQ